jgi:hypothetical protein
MVVSLASVLREPVVKKDGGDPSVKASSSRPRSLRLILAAGLLVACALALFSLGGRDRTKAYNEGWNYVVHFFKSGGFVGHSTTPTINCDSSAAAAWPASDGTRSNANYQKYLDWARGCDDALSWISSGGLNGLQIPFN